MKGTDIADQQITFYLCKTKFQKLTTIAFSYLLGICRINAASVLAINKYAEPRKQNLFEDGCSLVLKLLNLSLKASFSPVFLKLFLIAAHC